MSRSPPRPSPLAQRALRFALTTLCAATLCAAALCAATPSATAQNAQGGIPQRLRARLLGCLELPDGERMIIKRQGATGLRARWTARGRHGIETYSATMSYRADLDAVVSDCGPRTQHGQFCLFTVDAAGALHASRISRYSQRATPIEVRACGAATSRANP